ncbi:MAG TPA: SRPBCC family protein [Acidimicrobiales bacterium]|nr:SRPBCC family protein [Acidimicrobiales bacterium]
MDKPTFVYTTYIWTTPELLWQALTQPEFTLQYWGVAYESDWEAGSTFAVKLDRGGVTIVDPAQVVLESDPPRRLVYTWHTFTREWADAYGFDAAYLNKVAAEPRSTASFDMEPVGEQVKLTVVHSGFESGSTVLEGVSQGWPLILSALKTLLETGQALSLASDATGEEREAAR